MSQDDDPQIQLLREILARQNTMEQHLRGLRDVFEAIDVRLACVEEGVQIAARDTTQARAHGHWMRNTMTAIVANMEILLDVAQGKSRSSDTIEAARERMREAISG